MVANTGTYVDSPFHRYADGIDLSELRLEQLAHLPGLLIDARDSLRQGRGVDESAFAGKEIEGRAVIVHTGWSRHWGSPQYFEGHVFLTKGAAELLRDQGAALVGIDSYNIDDTADLTRPVHSILLGADIPICEHMTGLDQIAAGAAFWFYAVPVKLKGMGTFPVRAFAEID